MAEAIKNTVAWEVDGNAVKKVWNGSRSCVCCGFADGQQMDQVFFWGRMWEHWLAKTTCRIKSPVLGKVIMAQIVT